MHRYCMKHSGGGTHNKNTNALFKCICMARERGAGHQYTFEFSGALIRMPPPAAAAGAFAHDPALKFYRPLASLHRRAPGGEHNCAPFVNLVHYAFSQRARR